MELICAREIKQYGLALRYIALCNHKISESAGQAVAGRMGINQAKSVSEKG